MKPFQEMNRGWTSAIRFLEKHPMAYSPQDSPVNFARKHESGTETWRSEKKFEKKKGKPKRHVGTYSHVENQSEGGRKKTPQP